MKALYNLTDPKLLTFLVLHWKVKSECGIFSRFEYKGQEFLLNRSDYSIWYRTKKCYQVLKKSVV